MEDIDKLMLSDIHRLLEVIYGNQRKLIDEIKILREEQDRLKEEIKTSRMAAAGMLFIRR